MLVVASAALLVSATEAIPPHLADRVAGWQALANGNLGDSSTELFDAYLGLRADFKGRRFTLSEVKGLMSRVQELSDRHFISERVEHWPTLSEVLTKNGDDCDGLELLAYWTLRDAGEPVRRAVFTNEATGVWHIVTLWDHGGSTYILDPTGAMTLGVRKIGWLRGWKLMAEFTD